MNSWRPDDWEKKYQDGVDGKPYSSLYTMAYEDGASAIIGKQRETGVHREIGQPFDAPPANKPGTWFFIPDDK